MCAARREAVPVGPKPVTGGSHGYPASLRPLRMLSELPSARSPSAEASLAAFQIALPAQNPATGYRSAAAASTAQPSDCGARVSAPGCDLFLAECGFVFGILINSAT